MKHATFTRPLPLSLRRQRCSLGRHPWTAVLFDVDGTLLDSTEFVFGAIEHTLRSVGRSPPARTSLGQLLGPPLADCYRRLAPELDPVPLCGIHRAWQVERLSLLRPFANTKPTLRALRAAGIRCAAVTARSRVSSGASLRATGLADLLAFVISAEDTARTKPHPDPLWLALGRLGMSAEQAMMVGDTAADIQAGQAAGLTTVGAGYGFMGAAIQASRPDYLIGDIGEVLAIVGVVGENCRGGEP